MVDAGSGERVRVGPRRFEFGGKKVVQSWVKRFQGAITVCDRNGIILEMNDAAVRAFREQGGEGLIGTNLLDCHPEPAREKLERLLRTEQSNIYSVEKNGTRKLVYQTPWYEEDEYRGFVELILELPDPMPHFVRSG